MVFWLYQMSMRGFSPEAYREEIWEGKTTAWPAGRIMTDERPRQGDRILLWFTKTGNKEPGTYGWGVITKYRARSNVIEFRPAYPSDYLKMYPLYNDEVDRLVNEIRGPVPEATMWQVDESHARALREKIREWIK